jgi:hypothetical protein
MIYIVWYCTGRAPLAPILCVFFFFVISDISYCYIYEMLLFIIIIIIIIFERV